MDVNKDEMGEGKGSGDSIQYLNPESLFINYIVTTYRISVFFRVLMQGSITVAVSFIRNNAR